jgi:hypothetical protein
VQVRRLANTPVCMMLAWGFAAFETMNALGHAENVVVVLVLWYWRCVRGSCHLLRTQLEAAEADRDNDSGAGELQCVCFGLRGVPSGPFSCVWARLLCTQLAAGDADEVTALQVSSSLPSCSWVLQSTVVQLPLVVLTAGGSKGSRGCRQSDSSAGEQQFTWLFLVSKSTVLQLPIVVHTVGSSRGIWRCRWDDSRTGEQRLLYAVP